MNVSHVIAGCLVALATASQALAQPKDEPPFKRLRLGAPEEKKVPDIPFIRFSRIQVIHEQQEALPFNYWTTALTEEGQLVGLAAGGTILVLDLATGALDTIQPSTVPELAFMAELEGMGATKRIVLQHGRGRLTAGSVLALTPEGIFRVDARDLTLEWVAGLENIPPDADGSALKLVEHWEGSIEVRSEDTLRAWRLDADGGRLEPVLRSPAATWNALPDGASLDQLRRALPLGVRKPSTRLAFGPDRQFLVEPGGTLVERGGLWRFDPDSGARTWPLAYLGEVVHPLDRMLIAVLPDGSWVFWGSRIGRFPEGDRAMLYMISPADPLQARLEDLAGQGGRAVMAGDLEAWNHVFANLDALGSEGPAAGIAATVAATASFPPALGLHVADYAQAPAPYAIRLRIRMARRHLLELARKRGLDWESPSAPEPPTVGLPDGAQPEGLAPIQAPPLFGRLNALNHETGPVPEGPTPEGSLVSVDTLSAKVSRVDLATGATDVLRPGRTAGTQGWPALRGSSHLLLRRGASGFPEGTLLLAGATGLFHLDPRTRVLTHLIPGFCLPRRAHGSPYVLREDWDGTIHLFVRESPGAWRLEKREGAWLLQEVEDFLPPDQGDLMDALSRRPPGARIALPLKAFPSSTDEPFLELKGPESLPPGVWLASVPVTTARIWRDIEGSRPVLEDFLTEPLGTLAEIQAQYRLDPSTGAEIRSQDTLSWMALPGQRQLVAVLPDGSWLCAKQERFRGAGLRHSLHHFSPADALQVELAAIVGRGARAALEGHPAQVSEALLDLDELQGVRSPVNRVFRGLSAAHREGFFPPVLAQVIADYIEMPFWTKLRARLARRHLDDWAVSAGIPLEVPGGAPALLAVPAPPARQEP